MEKEKDLYEIAEAVHSKESFIEFVMALKADRELELSKEKMSPSSPYGSGACDWQNVSIDGFLDAMAEWTDATSAITNEPMVPPEPYWKSFAMILHAGKFYE